MKMEKKTKKFQTERERRRVSQRRRERRTDDDGWAVCAIYLSAVAFIIPVS